MQDLVIRRTPSAYDYPLLIGHLLSTLKVNHPHQQIVYADQRRISYLEFHERVKRLANALVDLGVQPGDTVAVMDWDTHRYLEYFFAVPMMGAVLHTINVRLSPKQVLYTINHAQPDLIIVHQDFMPLIEELKLEFEREIIIIPIGHGEKYEDWISSSSTSFNFPEFDENRTATLFYTTGTTGDPKGVTYSHRQLVLHTLGLLAGFGSFSGDSGLHRDDVYMPLTPLFHVHGWGFPYAATMLGLRQVYPNRYDPETILRLIDSEAVTFSHCVPTVLSMLLDHPHSKKVNLSRWKVIIGGSALSKSLQSRASKFGIRLHAAYGMSETCPFLTVADLSSTDPDAQSQTGFPGPLVDLRVVSPNMQDVPHDGLTTGEIVVKAPWLTNGYMDNPKASKDLWRNSYLHTGDVGYIRENGSLQVTDRLKDVIKTGGEWISSLTLENIASSCSNIEEVAAIGIPNEKWGERAVLVVKLLNNANPDLVRKDLMRKFREHFELGEISKWAIPDNIFFVEQLPKTSVGKLDKKVMRKYVLTLNETNNDR